MEKRDYGSGSISQMKNGKWTARIYIGIEQNGRRKVKAFYGDSKAEVRRKMAEYVKRGEMTTDFSDMKKQFISDFMMDWLENVKKGELKPKSYDRLKCTIVQNVIPAIGHLQVGTITDQHIRDMIKSMTKKGYSYSAVKKAYWAVKACFRSAIEARRITIDPTIGVAAPKKKLFEPSEIKFYTAQEAKLICDTALATYPNGTRIYPNGELIILAVNTGIRIAELCGLQWKKH